MLRKTLNPNLNSWISLIQINICFNFERYIFTNSTKSDESWTRFVHTFIEQCLFSLEKKGVIHFFYWNNHSISMAILKPLENLQTQENPNVNTHARIFMSINHKRNCANTIYIFYYCYLFKKTNTASSKK